jgi:hypothetical protein
LISLVGFNFLNNLLRGLSIDMLSVKRIALGPVLHIVFGYRTRSRRLKGFGVYEPVRIELNRDVNTLA